MKRIPSMIAILTFALQGAAVADTVLQIPVASILNTRSVTTLTDGKLVTWIIGIDGNGTGDGYLTRAASLFNGDVNPKALPDSGRIAADARHPEVVLNYSNADGTGNQTRYVRGAGDFTFPVPAAKYSKLFLFFTSAEGGSALTFLLTYSDGTETVNVSLPDYYNDLKPDDAVLFYLVKDLAKWNKTNKMAETGHHNIDGIELHPAAGKILTDVKVSKTAPGYLVFWGATGIATSPVSLLSGSSRTGEGSGRKGMLRVTGMGINGPGSGEAGRNAEPFSAAGRWLGGTGE
ncbi:MAG: hypothetical protein JWO30_3300 [Fibrobacteres bacterium]|nr:hypothetical protein [Fibrobacterota bacterium]